MEQRIRYPNLNQQFRENREKLVRQVEFKLLSLKLEKTKFKSVDPDNNKGIDLLADKLLRFLDEYGVSLKQIEDDVLVRLLCLMDLWLDALKDKDEIKLSQLKKIINQFNLATIVYNSSEKIYQQLGVRVVRDSVQPNSRFSVFNPQIQSGENQQQLMEIACKKILSEFVDQEKTEYINDHLFEIVPEAEYLFKDTIYTDSPKDSVKINILSLSQLALVNFPVGERYTFNGSAFCYMGEGNQVPAICIPFDSKNFVNDILHEFAHAFSYGKGFGIMRGYFGFWGRGFNEALTENKTAFPQSYTYPRYILQKIYNNNPGFEKLFNECYRGTVSRRELVKAVFNTYGSEGLIKFELMTSTNSELALKLNKLVLFSFQECLEFFDPDSEFIEVYNQMKDLVSVFLGSSFQSLKYRHIYSQILQNNSMAASEIINSLSHMLSVVNELPLEVLLDDKDRVVNFREFLDELAELESVESVESARRIAWLATIAVSWDNYFITKYNDYFFSNSTQPVQFPDLV